MWPQIITAVSALAVAVLGQAVFLSSESRRVRRIKAYLDVRGALGETAHHETLDELVSAEIQDEVRARQRARRFSALALRSLAWLLAATAFLAGAAAAWRWLDEGVLPWIAVALSAGAAVTAFARAGDLATEAKQVRAHTDEQSLIRAYADWALSTKLADKVLAESDGFDLLLLKDGDIVEAVEAKARIDARIVGHLFARRIKAVSRFGDVRFIVLTSDPPSEDFQDNLLRHGIFLAQPASDGFRLTAP